MLTKEHKKSIVDQKLLEYEVKMYVLEIERVALIAVGDSDGAEQLNKRLESLGVAHSAIKEMI